MKLTFAVAPFPIVWKDGLSLASGSFGWAAEGCQSVPIVHEDGRQLGHAAFY